MRNFYSITALSLLLLTPIVACDSRGKNHSSVISELETFVREVEKSYQDYSDEEWEEVEKTFKGFTETISSLDESRISREDIIRIDSLSGYYHSLRLKYKSKKAKDQIEHLYHRSKGFIEGLF